MVPHCEHPDCSRTAFWREPEVINQPARWCREHRGPNDVSPNAKVCEWTSPSGNDIFNFDNKLKVS
jgi:hypothetical protein